MQQRIERERKELEQGHVRIIKEYESRVRDLDSANRVSCLPAVCFCQVYYLCYYYYTVWRSGSVVRRMNEVALCWARLVLGWVTVFGRVYHLGM